MEKQDLDVDVRRERSGYWAQVRGLEGCFASGATLDELIEALREAISLYVGEGEPERILSHLTALRLEVEPQLRPPDADQLTQQASGRRRQAHRDDWPAGDV